MSSSSFEIVQHVRNGPTLQEMSRNLRALEGRTWSAGLVGAPATAAFIDRRTGAPTGSNVAEIAAAHEFGAGPNLPERPFMRATFANILTDLRAAGASVGVSTLFGDAGPALLAIAEYHAQAVRDLLEAGTELEALSARTLADPGRDPRGIPLVDTEQILGAVRAQED